jgi:hypothetical protein
MLSLVQHKDITRLPRERLSPLEIHTCVYWVLSLAHRNRLPPELRGRAVTYGTALRQLARIHRDENVQDFALLNQTARLIEQIVMSPGLSSAFEEESQTR